MHTQSELRSGYSAAATAFIGLKPSNDESNICHALGWSRHKFDSVAAGSTEDARANAAPIGASAEFDRAATKTIGTTAAATSKTDTTAKTHESVQQPTI